MSNHLRLKSKRILITAVLGLGLAGSATIALARSGDTSSADAAVTGSNSAANANDAAKTGAPAAERGERHAGSRVTALGAKPRPARAARETRCSTP